MRALIQRVSRAQISDSVAQKDVIASINKGVVILVAFETSDTPLCIEQMAQKIRSLRLFADASGKMNVGGAEAGAQYLVLSQFTLYAECKYGNRPSFEAAAPKPRAKEYYEHFLKSLGRLVNADSLKSGTFGSDLAVELVNDGPVTIWLDSKEVI